MPLLPIPINVPPSKNVDEMGLKGFGADLIDGYIDEMGNIIRRPGLKLFCTLGTSAAVDGLSWWQEEGKAIAISNGSVFEITASDGTFAEISADGDAFEVGVRPIFTNNDTELYAANGGKIIQIPNTGNTQHIEDEDAPTAVTHPCMAHTHLVANAVGTAQGHFSKVLAPTTWEYNWFTAEAKPDLMVAMTFDNMVLKLIGTESIERWRYDGSAPFVQEYQQYIERGTIAPYSFTRCNGVDYFLDQHRQAIKLNGLIPEIVSRAMGKYLMGLSGITDALGDFINVNGRPFWILTFKSAEVTLAMDLSTGWWYRWGWWDTNNAVHKHWRGNCSTICPGWNKTLIGDHSNGKVYELDESTYYDQVNSTTGILKTLVRSSHIDWGNLNALKICHGIHGRVKRVNVAKEADSATLIIRYRDNGKTSWTAEREITLGDVGDTEFKFSLTRLGSYYSRQWEVYCTDGAPTTIVDIKENFSFGS